VGVKAPGSPTTITFFLAVYSKLFRKVGGNPEWSEVAGILSPALIALKADVDTASTELTKRER